MTKSGTVREFEAVTSRNTIHGHQRVPLNATPGTSSGGNSRRYAALLRQQKKEQQEQQEQQQQQQQQQQEQQEQQEHRSEEKNMARRKLLQKQQKELEKKQTLKRSLTSERRGTYFGMYQPHNARPTSSSKLIDSGTKDVEKVLKRVKTQAEVVHERRKADAVKGIIHPNRRRPSQRVHMGTTPASLQRLRSMSIMTHESIDP